MLYTEIETEIISYKVHGSVMNYLAIFEGWFDPGNTIPPLTNQCNKVPSCKDQEVRVNPMDQE